MWSSFHIKNEDFGRKSLKWASSGRIHITHIQFFSYYSEVIRILFVLQVNMFTCILNQGQGRYNVYFGDICD